MVPPPPEVLRPVNVSVASRIFTKRVTCVVRVMSSLGIFMLAYLDDLLVAASSASLCAEHLQTVLCVLANNGWIGIMRKLRLMPSQSFQWLGLQWDLARFQSSLADQTLVRIRQSVGVLLSRPTVSRRQVNQA